MQSILIRLFKIFYVVSLHFAIHFWTLYAKLKFYTSGIQHNSITALGNPHINISLGGVCSIGDNFWIRSYAKYSDTGDNRPSKILVGKKGVLSIGNNVGMTSTAIICQNRIEIGNNVKIGGGTTIFDTNFHSLDAGIRASIDDPKHVKTASISIGDNVFIGTSCIITKGVHIGENSIVAAGSVVVKDIPANQIWGGNPAKFIKELE